MVELVHLVGDPMGVVPYELVWLVELFGFEKLLRFGVGRVRQDRLQVVVLQRRLGGVFHANKIIQ